MVQSLRRKLSRRSKQPRRTKAILITADGRERLDSRFRVDGRGPDPSPDHYPKAEDRRYFVSMGYAIEDDREIETDYYNFDALIS